jgi:hypothetical protein
MIGATIVGTVAVSLSPGSAQTTPIRTDVSFDIAARHSASVSQIISGVVTKESDPHDTWGICAEADPDGTWGT